MNIRTEERGLGTEGNSFDVHRAGKLAQSSAPSPESVGRSFSYGNSTAYPLRVRPLTGFTLVELLVVISVLSILASMLFSRVLFYQEMAEKAAMQQVVGALQSSLVLQYGHRLALGMGPEVNNLSTENPMDWLAQKPGNYAGELNAIKPAAIKPGNWAFDLSRRELIYVPDHAEYFVPAKNGYKWVRYRARLGFEAPGGHKGKGAQELTGVTFAPVEPYQWLILEK